MGHNRGMALKIGDKVKSADGREGAIILISPAGTSAMVLLHGGDEEGAHATSIDLDQLTVIDAYTDPD
jgi:hypothetical protein